MKDLESRVSEATEGKRAKSFLFQSLSMNLQRGNALCVMGTVAQNRKLEEIYYNLGTTSEQFRHKQKKIYWHFVIYFDP